ncbi:MT-A70 family methyltransferase [Profundibacter sp.]
MTDWPFDTLTPMKYGAILADPAWAYAMRSDKGYEKSPEAHYDTMPLDQIKALPVIDLAGPDCLLFMWSTWPHLDQALDVMQAWGFTYITGGSWIKRTVNWKLCFGNGYVLRSASEPYIVGRIGRPQTRSKSERNVINAPIDIAEIPDLIEAIRREHSRKPVQMRQMIERLLPRAYKAELFAREPWSDNDVWGNQVGKFTREAGNV